MLRWNRHLSPLDWRQPWLLPSVVRYVSFGVATLLGVLLLSPWWLNSWQAWSEAQAAQDELAAQQAATQTLQLQTVQWQQTQPSSSVPLADVAVLTQLAQQQGLHLSPLGLDQPQHSPALNALHLQQLPVHVKVQGAWGSWLNWLAQWPTAAPGVTVASLELKADPRGGISAQVVAVVPQFTAAEPAFELASVDGAHEASSDPFSAQAWLHTQRAHAEQHPSYARLIASELLRAREALEAYPRERLQYVGQIAANGEVEALVKVLPPASTKSDSPMMSVHRVRVGARLGQNFGKLLAVQPDQLVVQEVALSPSGEWHTREVHLPLHEAAP